MRRLRPPVLVIALVLVVLPLAAPLRAAAPAIGFLDPEFHKIGWDTLNLRLGDVNGDGLLDIVVVNNGKARVECLLQRADPAAPLPPVEMDPNELPNDRRFLSRPFLSEKKIFCLELGDLNGDGRTDMVYYGDPRELVVVYQNAQGEWGERRVFDISDGSPRSHTIGLGDLNGDGRTDMVLLGQNALYFIYQDEHGKLGRPLKESGVPQETSAIVLRDFNADGRPDLLFLRFSDPQPIALRFQDAAGRMGPELRCDAAPLRAVGFGDPLGDRHGNVVAIHSQSGRLILYDLAWETPETGPLSGALEGYSLRSAAARAAPVWAFGAFSEPKRTDLAVTAPDVNEIEMFFRDGDGRWTARAVFPSLQSVAALAPLEGPGGRAELLVLSPEESVIGLAAMDAQGRLSFPRPLPVVGKPTAMAAADVTGDGVPEVIYTSSDGGARTLRILARDAQGGFRETLAVPIEKARSDPEGLLVMDLSQDGRADICVFLPYEGMRVFRADGDPAAAGYKDLSLGREFGKGLIQNATLKSVGAADVDGDGKPELLLANKNFVRAVRLDAADQLVVVDQFNGRAPNSVIAAAAGADVDGDGAVEIVLVDTGARCLSVLKRNARNAFEIVQNLPIGAISFERLALCDLSGDGHPDVALLAKDGFRVLQPGRPRLTLKERAGYETAIRNGRLSDVSLGDLDGDGRDEILTTEETKRSLELIRWDPEGRALRHVLHWPVYEAHTAARGESAAPLNEPREFEISDVTRDGKPDLVLLIHDRVLIYAQE